MSKCKNIRDLFESAFLKELDREENEMFENHLKECDSCKKEYENMSSMLLFMKKKKEPEITSEFWDGYWGRLLERMEREEVLPAKKEKRTIIPRFNLRLKWAFQTMAAVLLVVIGIFIGRLMFSPSESSRKAEDPNLHRASLKANPELLVRARDYIEQSKVMFMAIINFESGKEDSFVLNLSQQQQISHKLVKEAQWIKDELEDSRQRRLKELIEDLEVILLQIANLSQEPDSSTIEMIREGITRRGILFKIQLTDLRRSLENKRSRTVY